MDRQAQRKALFRAKLRESSQNKRIDSPLVRYIRRCVCRYIWRYNENDQPVCRVCNITLKSESQWSAHEVSRKHHEAIQNLKATAAIVSQPQKVNAEIPAELHKPRSSSTLPADFFDNRETKRQKGVMHTKNLRRKSRTICRVWMTGLGEEEIDAAEIREEFESLEQQAYREKVEMVKKQLMEVKAARIAREQKSPAFKGRESRDESSSDNDDDDENCAVDWRAKHL